MSDSNSPPKIAICPPANMEEMKKNATTFQVNLQSYVTKLENDIKAKSKANTDPIFWPWLDVIAKDSLKVVKKFIEWNQHFIDGLENVHLDELITIKSQDIIECTDFKLPDIDEYRVSAMNFCPCEFRDEHDRGYILVRHHVKVITTALKMKRVLEE